MTDQPPANDAERPNGLHLRAVAWLATRRGWQRQGLALLAGALTATAMAPIYDLVGFVLGLCALVWIGDGCARSRRPGRAAFWSGWFFGLGYFIAGLWWVVNAILVDVARWWWAIPFAIAGLPMGLAFFWAAGLWLWRRIGFTGPARVAALAALLGLTEWLRGWTFTGFPWNLPAHAWWPFDSVLQTTALLGTYGLSVVTLVVAMAPAAGIDGVTGRVARGAWIWPAAALALVAAMAVGGHIRLGAAPDIESAEANTPDVMLRLVQANFTQSEKWADALRVPNVQTQIDLTQIEGWDEVTHVIWPETAVTFPVSDRPDWLTGLAVAAPIGGYLITGAPRVTVGIDGRRRVHNSLLAVSPTAQVAASYDKFHLVPFGEYMPLQGLLSITGTDFTPGAGPQTIGLPGLPPFSPLICYEAIFPGEVTAPPASAAGDATTAPKQAQAAGPAWLLNITNDAWYGDSPGPRQHLQIVRVRAIEEGLPLVRAANTGISAVFDGYGREVVRLGLGLRGVVDSPLPLPLEGGTLYAAFGEAGFWIIVVVLIAFAATFRRRQR